MPIKNNTTNARPLTKTIYINWSEREVYSQEEYEKHLNEAMEEMLEDESLFGEWLCDNLNYREIGKMAMDTAYREQLYTEYESHCRDRIHEDEDGDWEEVNLTF